MDELRADFEELGVFKCKSLFFYDLTDILRDRMLLNERELQLLRSHKVSGNKCSLETIEDTLLGLIKNGRSIPSEYYTWWMEEDKGGFENEGEMSEGRGTVGAEEAVEEEEAPQEEQEWEDVIATKEGDCEETEEVLESSFPNKESVSSELRLLSQKGRRGVYLANFYKVQYLSELVTEPIKRLCALCSGEKVYNQLYSLVIRGESLANDPSGKSSDVSSSMAIQDMASKHFAALSSEKKVEVIEEFTDWVCDHEKMDREELKQRLLTHDDNVGAMVEEFTSLFLKMKREELQIFYPRANEM